MTRWQTPKKKIKMYVRPRGRQTHEKQEKNDEGLSCVQLGKRSSRSKVAPMIVSCDSRALVFKRWTVTVLFCFLICTDFKFTRDSAMELGQTVTGIDVSGTRYLTT